MSSLEFSDDENDVDLQDTSATSSGLVSIVYCTPTEAIPLKTSLAQPVLPPTQEGDLTTEIDEMSEKELSAMKEAPKQPALPLVFSADHSSRLSVAARGESPRDAMLGC